MRTIRFMAIEFSSTLRVILKIYNRNMSIITLVLCIYYLSFSLTNAEIRGFKKKFTGFRVNSSAGLPGDGDSIKIKDFNEIRVFV